VKDFACLDRILFSVDYRIDGYMTTWQHGGKR
jgi:hypothetical protein